MLFKLDNFFQQIQTLLTLLNKLTQDHKYKCISPTKLTMLKLTIQTVVIFDSSYFTFDFLVLVFLIKKGMYWMCQRPLFVSFELKLIYENDMEIQGLILLLMLFLLLNMIVSTNSQSAFLDILSNTGCAHFLHSALMGLLHSTRVKSIKP